jgi:hypothetical protein
MHNAIQMMLNRYNPKNNEERQHAIKEIIQEIALAGLSRGGFFKFAAFYGGTSSRIFHGLNRFSEDLDFALIKQDSLFQIHEFFSALKKEFLSYGIELSIEEKNKSVTTVLILTRLSLPSTNEEIEPPTTRQLAAVTRLAMVASTIPRVNLSVSVTTRSLPPRIKRLPFPFITRQRTEEFPPVSVRLMVLVMVKHSLYTELVT